MTEQKHFGEVTHPEQYLMYFLSPTLRPAATRPLCLFPFLSHHRAVRQLPKGGDIS